jgi:glycosyltransferase involved in cell wall biosynthesis
MEEKKIKVLHIIAGDLNQGAARGAYWLHKGLISNGVNSVILNNGNLTGEQYENVININEFSFAARKINFLRSRLDIYTKKIYRNSRNEIFSTGLFGYDFLRLEAYRNADVIHFHWINGGLVNLKLFNDITKPIIWTIRDMWPFTGGCHYSLDCNRYLSECGSCFYLNSNKEKDLATYLFNRKKRIIEKNSVEVVGISNWISNEAKRSKILGGENISTIFNNIDTDVFRPYDKIETRRALKIDFDKTIILVGAINSKNTWKGFKFLKDALNRLDAEKYKVLTFGKIKSNDFNQIDLQITNLGLINDDVLLAKVYSLSDVYLTTAIQEAFGKTVVESMACGTPVVCFDNSGPSDLVTHKKEGYLAKAFSTIDVADGIEWIINNQNYKLLCKNSRKRALENFDYRVTSKKYIELYKRKLKK